MRPDVGLGGLAPGLIRGGHQDGLDRGRGGHVAGVRRYVGEDHRHGMLAGVAALDPCGIVRGVRVMGGSVRYCGMSVRRGSVVVVGVTVVDVGVDVLQRRRP